MQSPLDHLLGPPLVDDADDGQNEHILPDLEDGGCDLVDRQAQAVDKFGLFLLALGQRAILGCEDVRLVLQGSLRQRKLLGAPLRLGDGLLEPRRLLRHEGLLQFEQLAQRDELGPQELDLVREGHQSNALMRQRGRRASFTLSASGLRRSAARRVTGNRENRSTTKSWA